MRKEKGRHNPLKRQNLKGGWCASCDTFTGSPTNPNAFYDDESQSWCTCNYGENANICKGNPHNCVKTLYRRLASRSDKQIIDEVLS